MLYTVQLADELKKYGLTLSNYASIREQSVGGFIQVGNPCQLSLRRLLTCLFGP